MIFGVVELQALIVDPFPELPGEVAVHLRAGLDNAFYDVFGLVLLRNKLHLGLIAAEAEVNRRK